MLTSNLPINHEELRTILDFPFLSYPCCINESKGVILPCHQTIDCITSCSSNITHNSSRCSDQPTSWDMCIRYEGSQSLQSGNQTYRFNKLDFPTLGLPTKATLVAFSIKAFETFGKCFNSKILSKISPTPIPCNDDIGNGLPKPNFQKSSN